MPKRVKVKVILNPVKKPQIITDHIGHVLYRTSGPVKIISANPNRLVYRLVGSELDHTNHGEFIGFYKPVGYIVNPNWDDDDRYREIRPSNYPYMDYLLPRVGEAYLAGWPQPDQEKRYVHKKTIMFIGEDDDRLFKMLSQIEAIVAYGEEEVFM